MKKIKITRWQKKLNMESGKIVIKNNNLEDHELETIYHLAGFGYDIEALAPSNAPGTRNPDLLMMGTFWEMKAPTNNKEDTISDSFYKSIRQSGGRAVFDLRRIKRQKEAIEAEKVIMKLFVRARRMWRMVIIEKDGDTIDVTK